MKSSTGLIVLLTFLLLGALMPAATKELRKGNCPPSPPGKLEPCTKFCKTEDDCPMPMKCCDYKCKQICMAPMEMENKYSNLKSPGLF
ncbi:porwaprin-a-like [Anolis carolinensis]|uniref:porwaprin-a-like n=1 Tax=Anolis carolinensis TaxID=28377 RepID=UPI002F2B2EB6